MKSCEPSHLKDIESSELVVGDAVALVDSKAIAPVVIVGISRGHTQIVVKYIFFGQDRVKSETFLPSKRWLLLARKGCI